MKEDPVFCERQWALKQRREISYWREREVEKKEGRSSGSLVPGVVKNEPVVKVIDADQRFQPPPETENCRSLIFQNFMRTQWSDMGNFGWNSGYQKKKGNTNTFLIDRKTGRETNRFHLASGLSCGNRGVWTDETIPWNVDASRIGVIWGGVSRPTCLSVVVCEWTSQSEAKK